MSTNKKPTALPVKKITNQKTGLPTDKPAFKKAETPKSHPFAKTLVDLKTRILISITAMPTIGHNKNRVKTAESTVFLYTSIGNVIYCEKINLENNQRALEYVADFSQTQSARFVSSAIAYYKKNDPELNLQETLKMAAGEVSTDKKTDRT